MIKVLSIQKMSTRLLIGAGLILAAFVIMGSVSIARADTLTRQNVSVTWPGTFQTTN
jgi:hypothetical protein